MQGITVINHIADTGGCSFYRMRVPSWFAQSVARNLSVIESPKFIPIPDFYRDVRLVRLQRQVSGDQMQFFLKFLKPLSERMGFWTNYEIDDVVGKDDIPRYNSGFNAYQDPAFYNNIATIMQNVDYLTVTCEELGNYYINKFNVPKENVMVIPNYLPRWWIDGIYNIEAIEKRYDEHSKKKFRVVFPCSSTHYDIFMQNNGIDDFTHVVDFVRDNVGKYEFIFVGGCPKQLEDLAAERKISVIAGFDLFNYPKELNKLQPDVLIAPLQNNVFNRCKSNIKYAEAACMGIPVICQNLVTYRKYTDLLFDDNNSLQNKLDFVLSDKKRYLDMVKNFRNIADNGDSNAPKGWFLENNMEKWLKLLLIDQRPLNVDLRGNISKELASRQQTDNGVSELIFNSKV